MFNWLLSDEEYSASRRFIISAVFWLIFGMVVGFVASFQFILPDLVKGFPYLSFGRLRPLHINLVAFAWLSMVYVGSMYYMVPVLTRTKLYSEKIGNFNMVLWNVFIIGMVIALPMGVTEGREYAELFWVLDILAAGNIVIAGYNIIRTVLNRKEPQLYVSLWYFLGALCWMPVVYLVGNNTFTSWIPGFTVGINDASVNWFYGHNILGLWFTPIGVGMSYYLLPKYTRNPLYSHLLSLLGFFTIAMFYTPTGAHHLLQSPVPEWLKAIAVISSVMLLVPVLTVLINFFLTMGNKWGLIANNLGLRFLVFGNIFYLFTCVTGPMQATRWINFYVHFSHWVVAHAHLALLATFTFMSFASIYYVFPRVTGREFYSTSLIRAHFWFSFLGTSMMILVLVFAGLIQAAAWRQGITVYHTSIWVIPYMGMRTMSGVLLIIGQFILGYNMYRTLKAPVSEAAPTR